MGTSFSFALMANLVVFVSFGQLPPTNNVWELARPMMRTPAIRDKEKLNEAIAIARTLKAGIQRRAYSPEPRLFQLLLSLELMFAESTRDTQYASEVLDLHETLLEDMGKSTMLCEEEDLIALVHCNRLVVKQLALAFRTGKVEPMDLNSAADRAEAEIFRSLRLHRIDEVQTEWMIPTIADFRIVSARFKSSRQEEVDSLERASRILRDRYLFYELNLNERHWSEGYLKSHFRHLLSVSSLLLESDLVILDRKPVAGQAVGILKGAREDADMLAETWMNSKGDVRFFGECPFGFLVRTRVEFKLVELAPMEWEESTARISKQANWAKSMCGRFDDCKDVEEVETHSEDALYIKLLASLTSGWEAELLSRRPVDTGNR